MRIATLAASIVLASSALAQPAPPPSPLPGFKYDAEFFPNAHYNNDVPTPDSILGFRLGEKPVSPAQIEAVIKAIAAKSPRVRLFEYARTHEGRPLHYLVVSNDKLISRLDEFKAELARFADPRSVSAAEGDRLAQKLPLVAWMAYSIHGDEMSGSDASLSLLYHLAACTDQETSDLLANLVVIIDPIMNPDGRDRSVTLINQRRTTQPDVDDQSILHTQLWPSGRMNHYLFDMNRDWIFATQPETRGRVAAVNQWSPQYFLESHEMGSQDTFLFMPAREPINYNYPGHSHKWGDIIAREHAAALDAMGWRYYSGEWNESWYPGYSSTWGALRGAIEQLYEQANIQTDAVRRPEGTLQTYREAVHHQLVSSWANLKSLSTHRADIMRDYLAERRANVSDTGRFAKRLFAFPPSANTGRWARFLDLMLIQGFEVHAAATEFKASGIDRLGNRVADRAFPAGTILISTRQPLGNLIAAMLEFDPRFKDEFLTEERRELLRFDNSRLYDTTAWNIPMMFDVESFELDAAVPADAQHITSLPTPPAAPAPIAKPVAWVVSGADDRSVALAARLMERGIWVRYAEKPFTFADQSFPRGSILVVAKDNLNSSGSLGDSIRAATAELALSAVPVSTGLGEGDLPDLGGSFFQLLQPPRIALLAQSPIGPYGYGEIWHLLDHTLHIRASSMDFQNLDAADLRRYNVLIIPPGASDNDLKDKLPALKSWIEQGGTLIAIGSSATSFAKEGGIGATRLLPDVLTKLDDFRLAVIRDWEARSATPDSAAVYSHGAPTSFEYPWTIDEGDKPSEDELKRRDAWKRIFSPQGAILAARTDDRHWLAAGCAPMLPVLHEGATVLMAPPGVQAPIRYGVFVDAPPAPAPSNDRPETPADAKAQAKDDKKDDKPPPPGWRFAPKGHDLRLRMSGLLWPEAADRLANSAFVTRERVGNGQIILFATNPTTRAATLGTQRVLTNAMILGPGLGASTPIKP